MITTDLDIGVTQGVVIVLTQPEADCEVVCREVEQLLTGCFHSLTADC